MKSTNEQKLDQAISDLNNAISLVQEVSYDLNSGICGTSRFLVKITDIVSSDLNEKVTNIESLKNSLASQYDSIEWACSDADYERC